MTELLARPDARQAIERWLSAHGTLIEAAASSPEAEPLRGRGRVIVVPAPAGPWPTETRWVVRHYQRGGAVASLLGDRYLRTPVPRPVREFSLIQALESRGVPTAPGVAGAAYPAGPFYRGDLVTEWVEDSRDLAAVLFGAAQLDEAPAGSQGGVEPPSALEAAGGLVRLLHDHGVSHPDLNLKNILITGGPAGPRALIVDLDRVRIRSRLGQAARRRMLERFERSLRKWESRMASPGPPEWLEAFHRGYAAGERARAAAAEPGSRPAR